MPSNRADALVEQLLDVSRLQAGRTLELRTRPTDLVALARQVTADQQLLTEQHQITVLATLERLVGEWDSRRLERVVANLVGNAVKYSPAGGSVTVRIATADGWAILQVQDQGLGIPAQDLPRRVRAFSSRGERGRENTWDRRGTRQCPADHRATRRDDRRGKRTGQRNLLHRAPSPH